MTTDFYARAKSLSSIGPSKEYPSMIVNFSPPPPESVSSKFAEEILERLDSVESLNKKIKKLEETIERTRKNSNIRTLPSPQGEASLPLNLTSVDPSNIISYAVEFSPYVNSYMNLQTPMLQINYTENSIIAFCYLYNAVTFKKDSSDTIEQFLLRCVEQRYETRASLNAKALKENISLVAYINELDVCF